MSCRLAVPAFEPGIHTSPYTLLRLLASARPPLVVDLRPPAHSPRRTLSGSVAWRGGVWPFGDRQAVLVDEHGDHRTEEWVQRLKRAGHHQVRTLYGGLALYDHALDPLVVGDQRYLVLC